MEWDNSGFIIGDAESEVSSVLLGLDCTPALVQEAADTGADMIVTHHPLIFRGVKKISEADPVGKAVIMAIRKGIVVYACHTNMDMVRDGVSWTAASRLGLVDLRILDRDADGNGLGVIGRLPEPVSAADFLRHLKKTFGTGSIRHSRLVDIPVSVVALCGGSGSSLIGKAVSEGADIYVTADLSYHDFICPDGFMLADVGHFESESGIMETIYGILRKNFPNFAVRIGQMNNNPVYYF